jgi:hypothetical protein
MVAIPVYRDTELGLQVYLAKPPGELRLKNFNVLMKTLDQVLLF